ncbi:MAG: GGDEF domain-containing protein [Lachnospiraceae bacterium]|nr:GGDEF domain-containing protein [Lachnospiraceae bacterium]
MAERGPYGLTLKHHYMMNTFFLGAHILYFFWYYFEKMPIMFYYNLFSIAVFILAYFLIKLVGPHPVVFLNFAEIFVFMTMNVFFLGWDYGFEVYCIGFAVSGMLVDFIVVHKRKVTRISKTFLFFFLFYFIFIYFWCQSHTPYYTHGSIFVQRGIYLSNVLSTMFLIVALLYASMALVYDLEGKLEHAAVHDVLTGLHNRRYMMDYLRRWKKSSPQAARENRAWIAILDIDHFKRINDSYGHFSGDFVLKQLGQALLDLEAKNEGLLSARWGGEEFSIFFCPEKGTEEKDVARILDDFRREICEMKHCCEGREISCSVTIGAAAVRGTDTDEAQRLADARLYWGKENGRNRLVFSGPEGVMGNGGAASDAAPL